MTVRLSNITDGIAGMSVTGLTIKKLNEIPARVYGRNCPILYPEPLDFVVYEPPEKMTFGRGTTVKWMLRYNLTYTLLYAAIGSGRGMELFAPTILLAFAVFDKLMESHPLVTDVELVRPYGIGVPGPMYDPTGPSVAAGSPAAELFYGVRLTLQVQEQNG